MLWEEFTVLQWKNDQEKQNYSLRMKDSLNVLQGIYFGHI